MQKQREEYCAKLIQIAWKKHTATRRRERDEREGAKNTGVQDEKVQATETLPSIQEQTPPNSGSTDSLQARNSERTGTSLLNLLISLQRQEGHTS